MSRIQVACRLAIRLVAVLLVCLAALWVGWTTEGIVLASEIDWRACFANAANRAAGLPTTGWRVADIDPETLTMMVAAERARSGSTGLFLVTAVLGFVPLVLATLLARSPDRALAYAAASVALALAIRMIFDWSHGCDRKGTEGELAALAAPLLYGAASCVVVLSVWMGRRLLQNDSTR